MQLDPVERHSSSGPDRTNVQGKGKGKANARGVFSAFDPPKMATILFWCGSRIWIRCPHCSGQHHFRFQGYDLKCYSAYCRVPSKSYTFTFPAYFELDKEQGWLVNLHPQDTPEQAMTRAIDVASMAQISTLTVLLGQERVEAALPAAEILRPHEATAAEIFAQAYSGQISRPPYLTSLFLRCPATGTIKYMVEVATLPALNDEGTLRTVATMKRGRGYPEIMAVSGLGKLDNFPSNVLKTKWIAFNASAT